MAVRADIATTHDPAGRVHPPGARPHRLRPVDGRQRRDPEPLHRQGQRQGRLDHLHGRRGAHRQAQRRAGADPARRLDPAVLQDRRARTCSRSTRYMLDLRPFLAIEGQVLYHPSDRYLHELFFPDLRRHVGAGEPQEAAARRATAGCRRRSTTSPSWRWRWRRCSAARSAGWATARASPPPARPASPCACWASSPARPPTATPALNVLQYSPPLVCFIVCMLIVLRQHPARGPRRAPTPALAAARAEPGLMGVLGRLQIYVLTRTLAGLGAALVGDRLGGHADLLRRAVARLRRPRRRRLPAAGRADAAAVAVDHPAPAAVRLPVRDDGRLRDPEPALRAGRHARRRRLGLALHPAGGRRGVRCSACCDVAVLNPLAADLNGRYEDAKRRHRGRPRSRTAGSTADLAAPGRRAHPDRHPRPVARHAGRRRAACSTCRCSCRTSPPGGALQFTRRIEAAEARLDPGFWRLSDVREATPGAGSVRSETLSIPSTLDRRTAMEKFAAKDAVGFWRLPETIQRAETPASPPRPTGCATSSCWRRRCCSPACRCWPRPSRCG